jgi:hypothetical protein
MLAICLAASAFACPQQPPAPAPVAIDAGALRVELQPSRTAHLFHVVDQIAQWDQYCHKQYLAAFSDQDGKLADADVAMLQKHTAVRRRHGWGGGLEQTFYVGDDLEQALANGVAAGRLTADEAAVEREVFAHFAARIDALQKAEQPRLDAFAQRLQQEQPRLRELADKLARFTGEVHVTVPAFLIANPHDRNFGGGYNGGRLALEVPRVYDALPSFEHECLHAFLNVKEKSLTALLRTDATGLDWQTFNEGLAYALAPGLLRPDGAGDPLARDVAADTARGARLDDPYVRFRRFGLALRPLLREALDDPHATVESFVPRAVDVWRALRELESSAPPPHRDR